MQAKQGQQWQLAKKIQNYIFYLGEKVGEGSFSQVFRGTDLKNNQIVAVKKVRVGDVKSKIARRLLDCEIGVLRQLSHPQVIKCLDVHFSVNNCYIVTEFCEGGNLELLYKTSQSLPKHQIDKIILSLFRALQYLSALGVVHRDIKLSNILIKNGHYKLADFGFAIKARQNFKDVSIGSPLYMSPQGLIHHIYGPKTDIWAFGILIYQLLHGKTPLEGCRSEEELRKKVLQHPPIRSDICCNLRELLEGCLRIQETERYSVYQIGQSTYIRKLKQQEIQISSRVEKDVSMTDCSSTEKSLSLKELSPIFITNETAQALLSYCSLLHKVSKMSPSPSFQRCLVTLIRQLTTSHIQSTVKDKEADTQTAIRQFSQMIRNQLSCQSEISNSETAVFQEVLVECQRKAQKETKGALQFKLMAGQTQYLMKAMGEGCLDYFAKKSKAKQYLTTFSNRP